MADPAMKPIWYFVGLILSVMGAIIMLSGIYQVIDPPAVRTTLAELHPNLWWGAIMAAFGMILFVKTRKGNA